MSNFKRTASGEKELLARALKLNARTRTLLLLLESDDLKQLNRSAQEKIASPENYQVLIDLGLITQIGRSETIQAPIAATDQNVHVIKAPTNPQVQDITQVEAVPVSNTSAVPSTIDSTSQHVNTVSHVAVQEEEKSLEVQDMDFVEVKELMQQTLKQYCGLMAKNLVTAIGQSNSVQEVRQHQSKWLTSLFETRISRQQLNQLLNTINHNMDRIEVMNG